MALVSSHSNPLGTVMSLERREASLDDIENEFGVPVDITEDPALGQGGFDVTPAGR